MELVIYADGSIIGNGQENSVGGWACVVMAAGRERILVGHEYDTTNNRMEMMAVIEGLRFSRTRARVQVYSDSEYVIKGFTEGRVEKWAANNWARPRKRGGNRTGQHEPIPNGDLWLQLSDLDLRHEIEWHHVRGHTPTETHDAHAERQQICHDWAFSESTLARLVRDKGLMGMDFPTTLEGRTELIAEIRELRVPVDPPQSVAPELWVVKRRAKAKWESALEDEVFFIPTQPGEDGGKVACENAADSMNETDDTKGMSTFTTRSIPRYVAVRVRGEEDGAAAA